MSNDNRNTSSAKVDETRQQSSGIGTTRDEGGAEYRAERRPGTLPATRRDTGNPATLPTVGGKPADAGSVALDPGLAIIQQQVALLDWSLRDEWRPTPEQTKILQQEIDPEWVEVKYPNVPYLPGAWYRKVFDEAFGLGGWSLIEAGQPHKAADGYYQAFVFKVGPVPIKKVAGWMATPGGNSVLSPGIALEGMRTNAIMRVAKDLGVARNLWLPAWCRRWLREYCEVVGTVGKGTKVYARKDDEAGHDALAFALEERALAEQAAADGIGAESHLAEIVGAPRKKSVDMRARNEAKKMQMLADLADHLRSQKIDEDVAEEHDGWEEEEN